MKFFRIAISGIGIFVLLQACTNHVEMVYEESSYGTPLEIPPDLTQPSNRDELSYLVRDNKPATFSKGQVENESIALTVLPVMENVQLERDGAQRWLLIPDKPRNIWPFVRDFWLKNGFTLSSQDPVLGLIETDWTEYRKNMPMDGTKVAEQDNTKSKIYAMPTREKFRVRLERSDQPGMTELYLTHRGVYLDADGRIVVWKLRPSDPELEAEMLHRLMIYLGVEQDKTGGILSENAPHLQLASLSENKEGHPVLKVEVEFERAWRRVGLVLDRMDYIIEDRDRTEGTINLRFKDPLKEEQVKEEQGWFYSLFSSEDEDDFVNIQLKLRDEGDATHVTVHDQDGEFLEDTMAKKILLEALEQLQ